MYEIGCSRMNAIAQLLNEVAKTGEVPDPGEISAVMKRGQAAEREAARRGIRIAARKIVQLCAEGQDVDDVIATAATTYAPVTARGADGVDAGRRDAALIAGRVEQNIEKKRAAAREAVRQREPITDVLLSGVRAGGVDPADLDTFRLREDMSDSERREWRVRAAAAGEQVSRVFGSGNQGEARELARELADALAADLAGPSRPDPLRNADGREIAAVIKRRSAGVAD
jgi:hypothetical protein